MKWLARIGSLLLASLLLLFSLDVFENQDAWYMILFAFLIHNISTLVIIISFLFAWNQPMIGTLIYGSAGLIYSIFMFIRLRTEAFIPILSIGLPALLIAFLYFLSHKTIKKSNPSQTLSMIHPIKRCLGQWLHSPSSRY